jgi:beta-glucosidase-like glycosyl hydrolase
MKKTPYIIFTAWLLLMAACNRPVVRTTTAAAPEILDYTDQAEAWADSMVERMSPREMAAQMVMPAIYARTGKEEMTLAHLYADSLSIGGVMLLKGDVASARALIDTLQSHSDINMLIAIDAEWGLSMRFDDAPDFPVNGNLPEDISDQTLYDYGFELARESRLVGINVVLGPVLDVAAPGTPIGRRSYGEDPHRVALLGLAYARGLEDGNVLSVAKHFPGLGSASRDSHRIQPHINRTREILDSIDLYPFRKYIDNGLSGVMVGHLAVTALDTVVRSAAISPLVIHDLLRQQYGFEGLIFTDALNMKGLGKVDRPTVRAILAGADIVLAPIDTRNAVEELTQAIASGEISMSDARQRCRRILFYKYKLGLNGDTPHLRPATLPQDSLMSPQTKTIMRTLTTTE